MFVKAHAGDGIWTLWESAYDISFLGSPSVIQVADGDHDYLADDRFPGPWNYFYHYTTTEPRTEADSEDGVTKTFWLERWVSWSDDDGGKHMLVTDGSVYICNEDGATVEALR